MDPGRAVVEDHRHALVGAVQAVRERPAVAHRQFEGRRLKPGRSLLVPPVHSRTLLPARTCRAAVRAWVGTAQRITGSVLAHAKLRVLRTRSSGRTSGFAHPSRGFSMP